MLLAPPASAMPDGTPRTGFLLHPGPARDIYTPLLPVDYRTSPDVFRDADSAAYEQFNCGPVDGGTTQVIRSLSSGDGVSWSAPAVALGPTPGGRDSGGVCDPSVVQFGSYYYMAYTGFDGSRHAVFVARTPSLSQRWQKWNGQGWGVRPPQPIVAPDPGTGYGAAQPSLVVQPGQLAVFYDVHNGPVWQTRRASVSLGSGNVDTWPSQLTFGGVVLRHPGLDSVACGAAGGFYDSTGVAFDDDTHTYVALTVDNQDYPTSSLQAYESATGSSFTQALTVAFENESPIPDHTHAVSFVTDSSGHITSTKDAPFVYSYGGTNCPVKLAWQVAHEGTVRTGWESTLNPTSKAGDWHYSPDEWRVYTSGALTSSTVTGEPAHAYLSDPVFGSSAVIDLDYSQGAFPFSISSELGFGGSSGTGGYTVRVYTSGTVTLYRDDPDHPLAIGTVSGSASFYPNHLQVVLSRNTITVYNGLGGNSMLTPVLQYTSRDDLYLDGQISLGTNGMSTFSNLTVRDDVPADYRDQNDTAVDWKQTSGSWRVRAPSMLSSFVVGRDQIFLQGRSAPTANYNAHLGDGTYTATVQLNPGSSAQSWGGLDVTNADGLPNPDWSDSGYLVFIRANGNLGLWRGGSGQVVGDIATGLDPVASPVKLTVLKTAGTILVYVNHDLLPTIRYVDYSPSSPSVGAFGVSTDQAAGEITNVSYSAIGSG